MLKYKLGNLFEALPDSYLAHACNCVGVWGSGIALQFIERFPKSYKQYQYFCLSNPSPGDILICQRENGYQVICLFTSKNASDQVDSNVNIIEATKKCLQKLPSDKPIHMPLINSGVFRVPWEKTAPLLQQYDDLDITVWKYIE